MIEAPFRSAPDTAPHEPSPVQDAAGPRPSWALAALIVSAALGVAMVAVSFAGARVSDTWADPVLWVGLMVIVVPIALRLWGAEASRAERLALVAILGLSLYAVKVLLYPSAFTLHDELGHYRSVADVLRTGKLYTPNPTVPAYSYYPGTLSLTAALSRLSGLGIVPSGLAVVGMSRLLLICGLFLFVERVSRSARIAGLAVLLYTANPNFVFFDGQFAYESVALGLAAMALWAAARVADPDSPGWGELAVAVVLVCALVVTHHLTSYAVTLTIVVWALLRLLSPNRRSSGRLVLLAAIALAATGGYAVYAFAATKSDIGGSLTGSIHGLYQIMVGAAGSKKPFTAARGYPDPPLEQAAGLVSVALLLLLLPFGLFAAWRRRRNGPAVAILALAALAYPVSLAFRLTAAGTETSNRTSEFLFVGLGAIVAMALVALAQWTSRRRGREPAVLGLLAALYAGLVFAGGITVGTPPYDLLPAGYEVGADSRSVDAEGVSAAHWAAERLPAGQRFFGDETDNNLFGAYTRLVPQHGSAGRAAVGELFTAPAFGTSERRIITFDKLSYLVVDRRDSTALPRSGRYFDTGNPVSTYTSPLSPTALGKFAQVSCIQRVFASGNVVIYDTRRILGGCR